MLRTPPFLFGFTALAVHALLAQSPPPSGLTLQGNVVDDSDSQLPGAAVVAQCGPYQSSAKANPDGSFVLVVKQSLCTLTTTAPGFTPDSQVVRANPESGSLTIRMHVSGSSSAVQVNARQDAINVSKIDADPLDLPLAIQTVPNQLAQDQGFIRLLDVVRNVSGVTSKEAYMGVTDTFNIRGFDASSSLFNGFRRDYYGTVNDLSSLERVEVIKGPSSVTEGFLEPGGIVNVVTKQPLPDLISSFDLLYGAFGTGRGQFDFNLPISSRLFLRGTGAVERLGSFRDFVENDLDSFGVALNWIPGAATLLETRAYNTYLSGVPDRGFPIYALTFPDLLALPINRFLGEPQDQYRQRNTNISETLRQGLGAGWSLRTGVNYFQLNDYRDNTEVDGPDASNPTLLDRELTIVPGSSSTINAVGELAGEAAFLGIRHHVTAGADFQRLYNGYDFTENFDLSLFNPFAPVYNAFPRLQGPDTYLSHSYTYDTGFYAQDLITIGRHIRILAGGRQDVFRYHDREAVADTSVRLAQSAFSPRVGVVYQPIPWISLYSNYASSFNPQQGIVLLNGQDPTPSRGRQVEAGVKFSRGTSWSLTADAFQIEKTNVATAVPGNVDFSQLTGEERSRGVEFDGLYHWRRGLTVRGNFADLNATVTSDTQIPIGSHLINVPRLQGTLWVEGDLPHTPISAGFGWFAVGARQATLPNDYLVPSYNRFDAALFWKVRPGLKLQANIQNLTDVRYYTSQDYLLYPGAPLNAELSLHWMPQRIR